jgi:hypothetical protein
MIAVEALRFSQVSLPCPTQLRLVNWKGTFHLIDKQIKQLMTFLFFFGFFGAGGTVLEFELMAPSL